MTWQDRLSEGSYTPPGGEPVTFDFEDVSKSWTLRGTQFEFPDVDGQYIQRKGRSGYTYPLRVFFWGDDHDLEAAVFETALNVEGIGQLEHPVYGTVNVVPFGEVGYRSDLVTQANQTVIEVAFFDTIATVYPEAQTDAGAETLGAVEDFNAEAAGEFEGAVNLAGAVEQSQFVAKFEAFQAAAETGLAGIAATVEKVENKFNAINQSINASIDILVQQPLTLAAQTISLIQEPARAVSAIGDRLSAYANLARTSIDQVQSIVDDNDTRNTFHTADLYASTYVTGTVLSVLNNTFETKAEALEAAEFILALFDEVTDWRDETARDIGYVDTGGQYQQLQKSVALAAGFLVELSFSLRQERSLVLVKDRTPLDLCAELYGQVDEVLQFFIDSNNLSWQEHLILRKGRRVVYYV